MSGGFRKLVVSAVAFGVGLFALESAAQPRRIRPPRPRPAQLSSLKTAIGLEAARALLRAEASEERVRAFERLGAIGSEPALELLGRALDAGGAARDGRERLEVVRAMAPHASVPVARAALVRALGTSNGLDSSDPWLDLARQSAGLALARSGDPLALAALGQSLRQPGRSADAALEALSAYPPARIEPVLRARGTLTPALITLFETLNDPRTRPLLLAAALRATPELRARALLALSRQKDPEALELARRFRASEPHPALREAAVRVLVRSRAPEAPGALGELFASGNGSLENFETSVSIALESPSQPLTPVLIQALNRARAERAKDPAASEWQLGPLLSALGRSGGPAASAALAEIMSDPALALDAAYALALASDASAREALSRALHTGSPLTVRLALFASALRGFGLDDEVDGALGIAKRLLAAKDPADRASAAFALALADPARGRELLRSKDLAVVRAACGAMLRGGFADEAALRLESESDPVTRAALALALSDPRAAEKVPSAALEQLLDENGAAALLAAFALAARESEPNRLRSAGWLASGDVRLKIHAALGLGRSSLASSVGVLERTYREDPDERVRHAVVLAMSQRTEPARLRTLRLAASLDPDPATRQAARLALNGAKLPLFALGSGMLFGHVSSAKAGPMASGMLALATGPSGLALPFAADQDGVIAVAGLPQGPVQIDVAPASSVPTVNQKSPR